MTPSQQLLAIAIGLYLLECLIWPIANATLLVSYSLATWNIHRPRIQLLNGRRSVFLLSPLPPLGAHFVLSRFPVALTMEYLCARESDATAEHSTLLRWRDVSSIQPVEHDLRVNDRLFTRADTPVSARTTASLLLACSRGDDAQRSALIGDLLAGMFDESAVVRRVAEVRSAVLPVRILANLLFVAFFVVAPILCYLYSFAQIWPVLVAVCGSC